MKTKKTIRQTLAVLLVATLASFALAGSAFAATVHGADYHGSGSALETGEIDVLNVEGSAGETVFLTVKQNGRVLADKLPYTVGAQAAENDGSTWTGVATLDINSLDLNALDGTYTIEAYSNRAGDDLLYSGAIYGVYADLPDGTTKLIGTRTANKSEASRSFNPSETLYAGGRTYRLTESTEGDAGKGIVHYTYEAYDEAKTVDGVIKFVDSTGAVLSTTKIPGLAYNEERKVDIPAVITADNGDMYRIVFFKSSVTAKNPGQTSFTIYCAKMSDADKALAGFYVANIQMVDENDRVIASDSVDVTGEFIYTAPSTIYKTEAGVSAIGEAAVVTYEIDQTPVIRLSAANDGVLNRERTVKVQYKTQPLESTDVAVTFRFLDGSKRMSEQTPGLGSKKVVATDADPVVEPPETIESNGVKYYLVGSPSDYAYTLHSGAVPSINVYYVPEGYEAPGPYDVTVNYVNFLTNTVVESHVYTSDPGENGRIAIDTPEAFSADGVDYVRLDGQEASIEHSYYSGINEYSVYYRDVNDVMTSETVINTIRVVYEQGPGTAADATASGEGTAAGANAGANDEGTQSLQLNDGRTYNVFDGTDNNATLTNESGVNSNTERIEDSETPLSSGFDKGGTSSAASSFMQMSSWLLPVGIAVGVIAIGAIVALAILRRRDNEEYGM